MTGRIIAAAVLLLAALAVVDAVIVIAVGRRRRALAYMENWPGDCELELDVAKRDGSGLVDFRICVKNGDVCTSRVVPICSRTGKKLCEGLHPDSLDAAFKAKYPDAYAEVCEDTQLPVGELCTDTDVVYETCGAATAQSQRICLPLANGELECADIDEDERLMIQSLNNPAPQAPYRRPSPQGWPGYPRRYNRED